MLKQTLFYYSQKAFKISPLKHVTKFASMYPFSMLGAVLFSSKTYSNFS